MAHTALLMLISKFGPRPERQGELQELTFEQLERVMTGLMDAEDERALLGDVTT